MGSDERVRDVSIREVAYVIFKRKRLILTVFILVVLGIGVGLLLTPRGYEATATFVLKRERGELLVSPMQGAAGNVNLKVQLDQDLRSEAELVKRRSLLISIVQTLGAEAVLSGKLPTQAASTTEPPGLVTRVSQVAGEVFGLARPALAVPASIAGYLNSKEPMTSVDQAIAALDTRIKVAAIDNSNIIKVVFTADDRKLAAGVMDVLVKRYMDEYSRIRTSPGTVEFFRKEREDLARNLREAEDKMQSYAQTLGMTPLNRQREMYLTAAFDRQTAAQAAQTEAVGLKEKSRVLREQLQAQPERIRVEEELKPNPAAQQMRAKLIDLDIQRNHLLQLYTEQDRRVTDLEEEITKLKTRFLAETPWERTRETYAENRVRQPLMVELVNTEGELLRTEIRAKNLARETADLNTKLKLVDASLYDRSRYEREVKVLEDNYLLYSKKYEEARISRALDDSRILNVTLAEPVQVAPKPGKAVQLGLLGAMVGLVAGVGLAFMREYFDDSLTTDESVRRQLELPVLASIPDKRA